MVYFAELREVLSKTDAVQIIVAGEEEEPYENYLTINDVPSKYNLYKVIGVGGNNTIETDYGIMNGTEVLLQNIHATSTDRITNGVTSMAENLSNDTLAKNEGGLQKWMSKCQ